MKNRGIAKSSVTKDIEVDLGVPSSDSLSFSENSPGASPLDLQNESIIAQFFKNSCKATIS